MVAISLVAELLQLIAQRPLVLVGASGSGKSRWFALELSPARRATARGPISALILTPDQDPLFHRGALLAAGLAAAAARHAAPESARDAVTLASALRPPDERWLMLCRSFEEIFTPAPILLGKPRLSQGLVALAGQTQVDVRVVLGMCSDFFDRFGPYPAFGKLTQQGLCLVLDMQPSELRMAIEQPAASMAWFSKMGSWTRSSQPCRGGPVPCRFCSTRWTDCGGRTPAS